MSDLLNDNHLITVKFGDIAHLVTESVKNPEAEGLSRYIGLEHLRPTEINISSWGEVSDGTTFTRKFKKGDVLFGRRRSYQRKAAVASFDGVCSGDILVFRAKQGVVDPTLLPFLVQNDKFFDYAVMTSAGSLSPRTKFKDLAKMDILLPDIETQATIAKILVSAQDYISNLQKMATTLDSYLSTVTNLAFSGAQEYLKVGEIADVRSGKRLPKGHTLKDGATNHPYIRVTDFVNNSVRTSELKYLSKETQSIIKKYIINKDDVYISIAGTVGVVGVIPETLDGANLTENAARLVIKDHKQINYKYLMEYLNSATGQKSITKMTMTTSQPKLALHRLASIMVPIVKYDEQSKLVDKIESIKDAMRKNLQTVKAVSDIKTSVLNEMVG